MKHPCQPDVFITLMLCYHKGTSDYITYNNIKPFIINNHIKTFWIKTRVRCFYAYFRFGGTGGDCLWSAGGAGGCRPSGNLGTGLFGTANIPAAPVAVSVSDNNASFRPDIMSEKLGLLSASICQHSAMICCLKKETPQTNDTIILLSRYFYYGTVISGSSLLRNNYRYSNLA